MPRTRFGPNSAAASAFLEALERINTPELVSLAAAGGGSVGTAPDDPFVTRRAALRGALREIAVAAGRLDAIREIGDEVQLWAGSAHHWFPAGIAGSSDLAQGLGPRMAALQIVLDAAYAVVLADQLHGEELDLLLGPWREVVGDPFAPSTGRDRQPDFEVDPSPSGETGDDDRPDEAG